MATKVKNTANDLQLDKILSQQLQTITHFRDLDTKSSLSYKFGLTNVNVHSIFATVTKGHAIFTHNDIIN